MRSGDMRRRATLQRATVTPNELNSQIETWITLAVVWCAKRDVSAGEAMRAQETGAKLSTRFRIRYSAVVADLNPRDRVVFEGEEFNITGVRESKRDRWLEIDCVSRADIEAETTS